MVESHPIHQEVVNSVSQTSDTTADKLDEALQLIQSELQRSVNNHDRLPGGAALFYSGKNKVRYHSHPDVWDEHIPDWWETSLIEAAQKCHHQQFKDWAQNDRNYWNPDADPEVKYTGIIVNLPSDRPGVPTFDHITDWYFTHAYGDLDKFGVEVQATLRGSDGELTVTAYLTAGSQSDRVQQETVIESDNATITDNISYTFSPRQTGLRDRCLTHIDSRYVEYSKHVMRQCEACGRGSNDKSDDEFIIDSHPDPKTPDTEVNMCPECYPQYVAENTTISEKQASLLMWLQRGVHDPEEIASRIDSTKGSVNVMRHNLLNGDKRVKAEQTVAILDRTETQVESDSH